VIGQIAKLEECLRDAGGSQSRAKNILIIWQVAPGEQAIYVGVVAADLLVPCTVLPESFILLDVVVERIFVPSLYCLLDGCIFP
jgi:hypothetical protein